MVMLEDVVIVVAVGWRLLWRRGGAGGVAVRRGGRGGVDCGGPAGVVEPHRAWGGCVGGGSVCLRRQQQGGRSASIPRPKQTAILACTPEHSWGPPVGGGVGDGKLPVSPSVGGAYCTPSLRNTGGEGSRRGLASNRWHCPTNVAQGAYTETHFGTGRPQGARSRFPTGKRLKTNM